jgi:hypothetical protein
MKHQIPNTKLQRNIKLQAPSRDRSKVWFGAWYLELGTWSFPGAWSLVFGAWSLELETWSLIKL